MVHSVCQESVLDSEALLHFADSQEPDVDFQDTQDIPDTQPFDGDWMDMPLTELAKAEDHGSDPMSHISRDDTNAEDSGRREGFGGLRRAPCQDKHYEDSLLWWYLDSIAEVFLTLH